MHFLMSKDMKECGKLNFNPIQLHIEIKMVKSKVVNGE